MISMIAINRSGLFSVALLVSSLLCGSVSAASNRYYHSDNTSPFVKMMLVMMDAMGILDRVPYGSYGRYGNAYSPYSVSPWNRYAGNSFTGSRWGQTPWSNSPWSGSPWGYRDPAGYSPIWGSPDWGVLPVEYYNYNNYAPYSTRWSSEELSDWVKEPWEESEWNPGARRSTDSSPVDPDQHDSQPVPIVQNFNLNVAEDAVMKKDRDAKPQVDGGVRPEGRRNKRPDTVARDDQSRPVDSPLARLHRSQPQAAPVRRPDSFDGRRQQRERSDRVSADRQRAGARHQKPCITDFCGLKKPYIDGLWVAQDGEMLGIKNGRYLWTDGESRYLTGQLKMQNEYLLAKVDGYDRVMRYKYKLAGDYLLTMQQDGKIREFMRTPNNYSGQYPAYRPGS